MGWRVTGWLFGSCIRSRVKAGGVSVSGRVKKRRRQVLKRSKRSKAEGETDGRRNELHLPTCLMNVPAGRGGVQRRVKGSGSPGRGGMAGRQRSGKERLYGCRDTCCASKRRVAGGEGRGEGPCWAVSTPAFVHPQRVAARPSSFLPCVLRSRAGGGSGGWTMQVKQVHATGGFKCKSCFLSLLADMTKRCPCATHAYRYLLRKRRRPI